MLPAVYLQTRDCTMRNHEEWPCAFRRLWFRDTSFIVLPSIDNDSLLIAKASSLQIYGFIREHFFMEIWSKLYLNLELRIRAMNKSLFTCVVYLKSTPRKTITKSLCHKPSSPNLSTIPTELRLRIFDYVTRGISINVVGYRKERQDSFYFKQRGYCPVALTCKDFHREAMEHYFKNLSVHIKSACPSDFSGDMSTFGGAAFRDRLKVVTISDPDAVRRSKICTAFRSARIELSDKYAASARKGAYYFS